MANEAVPVYGTTVIVSTAASTLVAAAMDSESKSALTQSYRLADLTLSVTFSVAPTVLGSIDIYRRDLNVDGSSDTPVPTATYTQKYVGSFNVESSTSIQYLSRESVPVSGDCELYLQNNTDQTMSLGWELKAKPWTWGPAS
jgi:hypothetical protein